MAKVKTKAGGAPAAAGARTADAGPWEQFGASWAVTFGVLLLLFLFFAWGPISRIGVHYPIGYNEGNTAYFTRQAMTGPGVYSAPPKYVFTGDPPLSYHVVGKLAKLSGDYVAAGRWVSVFAYFWIGLMAAMIVRKLSGSARCAAYAAFCWLIWLAVFDPIRIGYNEPHLLGIALGMSGLYCFVRDEESPKCLMVSAALFSLSLFTIHSLLAFPAAVAIQLFLTNKKRLGLWIGSTGAVCAVLFGLTLAIDGPYFLRHLMFPRTYVLSNFAESITVYGALLQGGFAGALIWVVRRGPHASSGRDRFLVWAFFIGHALGSFLCFGSGAGINPLFDTLLSLVLITGVGLPMLLRLVEGTRFPRTALAVLMTVPFFLDAALNIPRRMNYDTVLETRRPQRESEFIAAAGFVRSQPGEALCENPLLCYEAGKPKVFDAAAAQGLIKTGELQESVLLDALQRHEWASVEIDWNGNEPIRPSARAHFSEDFMRKLFASYKPAYRTSEALIFTPVRM